MSMCLHCIPVEYGHFAKPEHEAGVDRRIQTPVSPCGAPAAEVGRPSHPLLQRPRKATQIHFSNGSSQGVQQNRPTAGFGRRLYKRATQNENCSKGAEQVHSRHNGRRPPAHHFSPTPVVA